jgi:hypothetical protein
MAATQKLYPRGTVKGIVKAHSNRSVSKNADILVSSRSTVTLKLITDFSPCHYADLLRLYAFHARVSRQLALLAFPQASAVTIHAMSSPRGTAEILV